jgi:hypothetical protein
MIVPLSENPNGKTIVVVLGVFLVLDYIFVFTRFWARYLKKRAYEFNDWAMIAALVSGTYLCSLMDGLVLTYLGFCLCSILCGGGCCT